MGLVVFQQLERRRLGTLVSSRTVLSSGLSFFFFMPKVSLVLKLLSFMPFYQFHKTESLRRSRVDPRLSLG